jgi:hypothetical protein
MIRSLPLLCLALAFTPAARAADPPAAKPIDLALCLDVSNSMDGLIASAKQRLWYIVNDLARAQPTPDLRVALYSYGNTGYDPKAGWVRKELDFTTDLDEVYRKLNGLTTRGGQEYVGRVSRDALQDLKWSSAADALKIVFVCGNEPASQDPQVQLADVAAQAKKQGVIVNTIYCGPAQHGHAADWQQFAVMAGGRFANIDQDRGAVAVATPFDKELAAISGKLNGTYLCYGVHGQQKAENQVAQDGLALQASEGAAAARTITKAGALYRNSEWDLVDKCKEDPKFDVTKLPPEQLPEEMRKLKPEERAAHIKKKAEERAAIQKHVAELTAKREAFLQELRKKEPNAADKAFDEAVRAMLCEQAAPKGITIP